MQDTSVSIISPVFCEGIHILNFIKQVEEVMLPQRSAYEIILVDDGSTDDTWRYMQKAAADNGKIIAVKLSRNFGKEAAIYAGLQSAKGNVLITIDSNLSHPVQMLGAMMAFLSDNKVDIIEAARVKPAYKGFYGFCVEIFYKLFSFFVGIDFARTTDFKAFNKAALNVINAFGTDIKCYRGLSRWVNLRSFTMPFMPVEKGSVSFKYFRRKVFSGLRLIAVHSGNKLKNICNAVIIASLAALIILFKILPLAPAICLGVLFALLCAFAIYIKRLVYKAETSPKYEIAEIFYATKNIGK